MLWSRDSIPPGFRRSVMVLAAIFAGVVLGLAEEKAPTNVTANPAATPAHPLVWDAMEKSLDVKADDGAAEFVFNVKNTSDHPVVIDQIRPSCGCTVAEMPSEPWTLAPRASGSFRATIDFRGKTGRVSKALYVNSTAGTQMLGITVNIPEPDPAMRLRNQKLAEADRQAVFRGDCAKCHVPPGTAQKTGAELFTTVCGVCHTASSRASMVPDLFEPRELHDAAFWRKWISEGKEQGLMPAFAREKGGPLTREQIESLVQFAVLALPKEPRAK
jgi:cytochrome c5